MPLTPMHASAMASSLIVDADAQYGYAQKLFKNSSYASAIPEFQRFIHFFPNDSRKPEAMTYMGRAHYHLDQFGEAIQGFQKIIDRHDGHPEAFTAFFHIADCYIGLNQPQQAMVTLQNLITLAQNPDLVDKAYYKLGWLIVEAGAWSQATEAFKQISPQFQKKKTIEKLIFELEAEKIIPKKNPVLAGALSIIPGAGQLYCGRYQDALSAFFVNAGLILAAVESFENRLYALGATISFFEVGFYAGNINSAVSSARKYNQVQVQRYVRKLQGEYQISLSPVVHKDGLALSFQYFF